MRYSILLSLVIAVTVSGCSTIKISADYDPQGDFSNLRSYAWMHDEQPKTGNTFLDSQVLDTRIRRAVDDQLLSQGFRKASDDEDADFLLRYHVTIEDKTDITTFGNYDGYMWHRPYAYATGPGAYYHSPYAQTQTVVTQYQEGTLVVDIIQPEDEQLVLIWRGTAQAEVKQTAGPEQREKRIRKAVGDMFSYFPPSKKS